MLDTHARGAQRAATKARACKTSMSVVNALASQSSQRSPWNNRHWRLHYRDCALLHLPAPASRLTRSRRTFSLLSHAISLDSCSLLGMDHSAEQPSPRAWFAVQNRHRGPIHHSTLSAVASSRAPSLGASRTSSVLVPLARCSAEQEDTQVRRWRWRSSGGGDCGGTGAGGSR